MPEENGEHKIWRGIEKINSSKPCLQIDKTLIVLGVGRGGTSAISGCLRELGVHMPHAHPLKHEWSPISVDNGKVNIAETKINLSDLNSKHNIWGWKSPKDIFVLANCIHLIRNPHIIVVYRNPLDICESSFRHEDIEIQALLPDISQVFDTLSRFILLSTVPVLLISYEKSQQFPHDVVTELDNWLGLSSDSTKLSNAVDFISKGKYSSLSFENNIESISRHELIFDQKNAQSTVYSKRCKELSEATSAIEKDCAVARDQVAHLRSKISELALNNKDKLGINEDMASRVFLLNYDDFKNLILASNMNKVKQQPDLAGEVSTFNTHEKNIEDSIIPNPESARLFYDRTKTRYQNAARDRQKLQDEIENLVDNCTLINNIALSCFEIE